MCFRNYEQLLWRRVTIAAGVLAIGAGKHGAHALAAAFRAGVNFVRIYAVYEVMCGSNNKVLPRSCYRVRSQENCVRAQGMLRQRQLSGECSVAVNLM